MTELSQQEPSNKTQDEKSAWGPLAKPPYSGVDVTKLSAEEQAQARAKINSYIESVKKRMIQDRQMKNKQEELGRKRAIDIQQDNQSHTQDTQPSSIHSYTSHNGDQSYDHGSSRKANTRYTPYHPYSRPIPRFSNNSVTFSHNDQQPTKIKAPCSTFTMTGTCYHNGCHLKYSHDPYKVTVCKDWLYHGGCALGSACPLSHSSSHHSTPTCTHFQKGRCTNDTCRFAHVRVNPNAQNCVAFGQLGYCDKGNNCAEIHSYECPYFANGNCRFGDKCRMPHKHNASRMRQQDRPSSESCSQASSYKDMDSPKIHVSDMLETREILGETTSDRENHHIFTQQNDFVPLDS